VDGGVASNNPSWEAVVEGKNHWSTTKCFIVSVGTGVQRPVDFIGGTKSPAPRETTTVNIQSGDPTADQSGNVESSRQVLQPASTQWSKSFFGGVTEVLKNADTTLGGTASAAMQFVTDKAAQIIRIPAGITTSVHIMNAVAKLSTSSESTHERVYREANSKDESAQFPYFRFNVLRGMDTIGLEEWSKVEAMTALTRSYLQSPSVQTELRKCAEGLVTPSALEST
jgi:hypothetical protein